MSDKSLINWRALKEALEVSGKTLIGFVGLCYVLGILVVTVHLRRYGLNSLSFSQLHYVTAGAWALVPIALVSGVIAAVASIVKLSDYVSSTIGWTLGIVLSIAGYIASSFGVIGGWVNWIFVPFVGVLALSIVAWLAYKLAEGGASKSEFPKIVGAVLLAVLLSLLYISLFAQRTYENIPWTTGGGGASQVQMIIATDAKPYLESMGIKFSNQNQTESLKLLLNTDKDYVVINANGKAVSIPFETVKSVLYEK
jgi:hypothetical protein